MPRYFYKAKKGLAQSSEGFIEADNQEDALNRLIQQGLFPINITDASAAEAKKKKRFSFIRFKRKITSTEVLAFTQKLATLIRARLELLSSVRILYEQTENPHFKEAIQEIYNSIKEGKTFSESLERFPRIFPPLFINIIKSGEASGRLDSALEQISEFLYRQESLKSKVMIAMAYPLLLLLVGFASIFVLLTFVVPKLRPIFEGFSGELPAITKIILKVSMFSNKTWWITLAVILMPASIIYFKKGGELFRRLAGKIISRLPILKRLTKNQELDRFSRSLSLLLKSGVPALKSLEIATLGIQEHRLKEELGHVCKGVASGSSIAKCMEGLTSLPGFFTKMVAIGEESGRISEVLDEVCRSYTQQIEADIALATSLLEPILILVLGAVLGTIVLSILLPTFQVTQFVR